MTTTDYTSIVVYPNDVTDEQKGVCTHVVRLLEKFEAAGETPRELADFMRDQGVRGTQGNGFYCALAEYINTALDEGWIAGVSSTGIVTVMPGERPATVSGKLPVGLVPLPSERMKIYSNPKREAFIKEFDKNSFPEITRAS